MRKAWKRLAGRAGLAAGLWAAGTAACWASLALAGPGSAAGTAGAGFLAGAALGLYAAGVVAGVALGDALADAWLGRPGD